MPGKHPTWANASSQVRPLKSKHADPAAGISSHFLLAGEGVPFVIVLELTPCQSAHLESVRKKEEHESQGLMTLPSSSPLVRSGKWASSVSTETKGEKNSQ